MASSTTDRASGLPLSQRQESSPEKQADKLPILRVAHQMASTAHGLAELPLLILLVLIMMNLMVAASTVQEKKDKKPLSKAWETHQYSIRSTRDQER
ncbi:Os11g0586600 [Oryza sativa Japonica Group]|uniref:Os11g0586600 protein n=1 Tax=Oryza sativa subsp. japonica TaxID=39947 RepID=A0A0P0Y3Y7_ORYSJ|nr:Os11g0586600 [Oryza sativa Japonica Group]